MKTARQTTGAAAEQLVGAWLTRQGYRVVERNARTPVGEIDVVAQEGKTLVFVEVRARRSARFGTPEESITSTKLQHMLRAAQWYLQHKGWREEFPVRLDVVTVRWSAAGEPQLNHIKNAFAG